MTNRTVLDLAYEVGLSPKKTSNTHGGEYHCGCPKCEGTDRFMLWSGTGRYWCRQCDAKGDAIQFCRDFMGLNFKEACAKVGQSPQVFVSSRVWPKNNFEPKPSIFPAETWQKRASKFIEKCQHNALREPFAMKLLKDRGFSHETLNRFQLGWNELDLFEDLNQWGLTDSEKRKVWLPRGIVIPSYLEGQPMKLKIRRADWFEGDVRPKYVEIQGSRKAPSFYGDNAKYLILLESELDAILLQQFAGDICTSMAIGGVKRRPDLYAHKRLLEYQRVLFSLDFDEAGKKGFKFWKELYPHLKPWPSPRGKSPGDAFKLGADLHSWVAAGLRN